MTLFEEIIASMRRSTSLYVLFLGMELLLVQPIRDMEDEIVLTQPVSLIHGAGAVTSGLPTNMVQNLKDIQPSRGVMDIAKGNNTALPKLVSPVHGVELVVAGQSAGVENNSKYTQAVRKEKETPESSHVALTRPVSLLHNGEVVPAGWHSGLEIGFKDQPVQGDMETAEASDIALAKPASVIHGSKFVFAALPDGQEKRLNDSRTIQERIEIVKASGFALTQPTSLFHGRHAVAGLPAGLEKRFTDIQYAGSGSFANVYAARDLNTNDKVAIKVPKYDFSVQELKRSCDKIKKLTNHVQKTHGGKHIMRCLHSDSRYTVFEWAGEEGSSVLEKEASLDSALGLLKQVILALYAMHHSSPPFVHHDLKWKNVAVDGKCLRLIDLDDHVEGIWKHRIYSSRAVYTPFYAPPELDPTKRTNVFFCGLSSRFPQATDAVCPGAYAFDMFSAGLMACQACALDWMTAVLEVERVLAEAEGVAKATRTDLHVAVPLLGLSYLRTRVGSLSLDLEAFDPARILVLVHHFRDRDPHMAGVAQKATKRLEQCKKLLEIGAIAEIERMIARKPTQRITPGQLLQSSLLKGVRTDCGLDVDLVKDDIDTKSAVFQVEEDLHGSAKLSFSFSWLCLVIVFMSQ